MRIEVTDSDIAHGMRHSDDYCPIALAIRRALPNISNIDVGGSTIWADGACAFTPVRAERFIWRFDNGLEVAPFRFELRLK